MAKIVFLTGAGISAPSGIATYRGKDGIYTNQPELESLLNVKNLSGARQKELFEYTTGLRDYIAEREPNAAHHAIAALQSDHEVLVVTQNIDNLHIRAGSTDVIELHGNLFRDVERPTGVIRPDVVFFGEYLTAGLMDRALDSLLRAEIIVAIGTSATVYPAATLMELASEQAFFKKDCSFYVLGMEPPEMHLPYSKFVEGSCDETLPRLIAALNL